MRKWWGCRWTAREWLAGLRYTWLLLMMNVGTLSYGLALGWVSLASGEGGYTSTSGATSEAGSGEGNEADTEEGVGLVWGAASTFAGALLGVALSAYALVLPRRVGLLLVSILFTVCWTLKLIAWAGVGEADGVVVAGGGWRWWVVGAARVCAGLAGNLAWCLAPVFAKEVSVGAGYPGGLGACVPAVAHNVGMLLMYLCADCKLHPQVVVWWCCVGSGCHCVAVMLLMPESPAYLAAANNRKEAMEVVAWLRARRVEDAALGAELGTLTHNDQRHRATTTVLKDMWLSNGRTRRAVCACVWLVAGQQLCGVLAIEQFAERVFLMLRPHEPLAESLALSHGEQAAMTAARFALILGAAQLIASLIALYLVDRVNHRVLILSSGVATSLLLGGGAVLSRSKAGGRRGAWAGAAVVAATAADSLGLHPVPYAVVTEVFHYEERGAVLCISYAAEELVSGLQTAGYAWAAARGGVWTALATAAAATAAYAAAAAVVLPTAPEKDKEDDANTC